MARTRCGWCKKRRKTLHIRVAMTMIVPDGRRPIRWVRNWNLCDKCNGACSNELDTWAFHVTTECGQE